MPRFSVNWTAPAKSIDEVTGYNERTVRGLKRGEFRPSAEKLRRLTDLPPRLVEAHRNAMGPQREEAAADGGNVKKRDTESGGGLPA